MDAPAAAIELLTERLRGFLRSPGCRLLHIVADADLRRPTVKTVLAAEHAPDNPSAFVAFEQPFADAAPGWTLRRDAAREQHEARRTRDDDAVPELPPAPQADGLVGFAEQLWQLVERRPRSSEGVVAVLAPKSVVQPRAWAQAVGRLVSGPSLSAVRFVVVDGGSATIESLVTKLGPAARRVDVSALGYDASAALAERAAGRAGAAPHDAIPPDRPDVVRGEPTEEAKTRAAVGDRVIAAALAMGRGEPAAAVAAQREARDLCTKAGWGADAARMELVLGGQLMAAGQPKAAESSFVRALDAARMADEPTGVATAGFAVGAVRTATAQRHTALVAYAEAAVAADRSDDPLLAIEGNRLAGQAAADIKMEPQAITFFTRAVKLAEAAPPHIVSRTSAANAARGLATLCRKRGLGARARQLSAQAEAFERPVAPVETPAPLEPDSTALDAWTPADRVAPPEPEPEPASVFDLSSADAADASLPAADLLGPQAPPDPDPGPELFASAEPGLVLPASPEPDAVPPPMLAAMPTPEDFGEGTGMLTLQEIADMHWGGQTKPSEGVRPWTPEEIGILQHAVDEALEPEATTMLSHDELAALRGQPRPSAPKPAPPPLVITDEPIVGLEPVAPEATPASDALPPSVSPSFDPDEVTSVSLDEVAAFRKRLRDDKDDDS